MFRIYLVFTSQPLIPSLPVVRAPDEKAQKASPDCRLRFRYGEASKTPSETSWRCQIVIAAKWLARSVENRKINC